MIEVRDVRKTFGRVQALRGVSFTLSQGVTGLLGPNGAGKTTLIRCMLGIVPPTAGTVELGGQADRVRKAVGYLPQKFGLLRELRVREALEYLGTLKGIPANAMDDAIESSLRKVNMLEHAQTRVGALSGGMTRRVGIAAALLGNPPVLVFDEPTAGLDPEERVRFKRLIGELDSATSILISTHIVEDLEALATRIIVLTSGVVAAEGTPAEIAGIAEGRVFRVPREQTHEHSDAYFIIRYEQHDGSAFARVLGDRPLAGFSLVEPTLEDGYLAIIQKASDA
ncbi:MAG: ATP-binding cassette domain-containing protein [Coriobacteriia bacterium]|nr:ATP-binding cassette domain-containing protein [Coriobacteriia bacterium]